jgi:hypothetical protein
MEQIHKAQTSNHSCLYGQILFHVRKTQNSVTKFNFHLSLLKKIIVEDNLQDYGNMLTNVHFDNSLVHKFIELKKGRSVCAVQTYLLHTYLPHSFLLPTFMTN